MSQWRKRITSRLSHALSTGLSSIMISGVALLGLSASPGLASDTHEPTKVASARHACGSGESWTFAGEIREDFAGDFGAFLAGKTSAVAGFSDALALRRIAQNSDARSFSEYWIARTLFQAKLYHIAHAAFTQIASRAPTESNIGIQTASLECLLRIEEKYPAIKLPESVFRLLPQYLSLQKKNLGNQVSVSWEAVHSLLRLQIAENAPKDRLEKTLALLTGSGAFEALGKALLAARLNEHGMTIREIRKYFEQVASAPALSRFSDGAMILAARAHYSLQQFDRAIDFYKRVSKKSNDLANTLSELSWAYLLADRDGEAIGTAMNLEAGGLRHTFEPEAPMVMAMALNELCQYPESVRAIQLFRKNYEPSYRWLAAWTHGEPLYPLALDYLKKRGKTPDRIASEWVKSPLFISDQDEINLIFDEVENSTRLGRSGAQEQRATAQALITMLDELTPRFHAAKAKQKPGDHLPPELIKELKALRAKLTHYRRLQNAAPTWRAILANHQGRVPALQARLVAEINDDLIVRTERMKDQLDEITENLQLVEVEIFNGASHDIIWQNAHPDYKRIANRFREDGEHAEGEKVWNWGKTSMGSDDSVEIWEDELGSFQANLMDNCSSKDRYLALKLKERSK